MTIIHSLVKSKNDVHVITVVMYLTDIIVMLTIVRRQR